MLHAGTSLEVFKRWCGDERNVVIMPGYCVSGTVGAKALSGAKKVRTFHYKKPIAHTNSRLTVCYPD
jgi:integrator complex subunit 11